MEAVAAAASIAGIVTVVGQSIDGLIKFSEFFSDVSSASKTISRLLNDINSLIQVLSNIGQVLERAEARRPDQNFASLDVKLEDCAKDVQIWLATARVLRPASNGGGKALLKKFRMAVNSTAIHTIREEIGRHKQTLTLSLAVFGRTIDIDTSDQVHQIGGRVDEALSATLSIHSTHEEALKRIEQYSMTSMHSSAHSIRSMDSIRTELSRLEAMITSTTVAHPSEIQTRNSHPRRGSIEEVGNPGSNLSGSGPLSGHSGESSTARGSGLAISPRQRSLDLPRKTVHRSSQSLRTREMAVDHCVKSDNRILSTDHHSLLDKPADIESQHVEDSSGEANNSSFLYAEFSKNPQPRQQESLDIDLDCGAIHRILKGSLASIYPPEVMEYVSLRQVTTLCENHIHLLDQRPSVQRSAIGKMRSTSYVDDGTPASARSTMIDLRNRLIGLRNAIRVSREQCIQAGYSLTELDKLLFPPGSGNYVSADRTQPRPETDGGDDSSSVYSEDFHSSTK